MWPSSTRSTKNRWNNSTQTSVGSPCNWRGSKKSGLNPAPPSADEVALKRRIDEIYTERPYYGSRRITVALKLEGCDIDCKRVQSAMRQIGISGVCSGPNLSKRNMQHKVYPYLLRNV